MRDITADLRERLMAVVGLESDAWAEHNEFMKAHEQKLAALETERTMLEQMLVAEERRRNGTLNGTNRPARFVRLADFLISKIRACGPMDKEQLRAESDQAGYFLDGNGRTFHTTLMNITNGGRLIRQADGRYALPANPPDTLFGMGRSNGEAEMKMLM
jgi:hypothetical protein